MRRRALIACGIAGSSFGGIGAAKATRADIWLERNTWRAKGRPATIRVHRTRAQAREQTANRERTATALSEDRWAEMEMSSIAAERILEIVERRLGEPIESLGRGIRSLFFGYLVTVDRITKYDSDGSLLREPSLDKVTLLEAAPTRLRVVLETDTETYARKYPVAVTNSTVRMQ